MPRSARDLAELSASLSVLAQTTTFCIVPTLAKLLAGNANAKRGLISVCTAGGMGVTAILER